MLLSKMLWKISTIAIVSTRAFAQTILQIKWNYILATFYLLLEMTVHAGNTIIQLLQKSCKFWHLFDLFKFNELTDYDSDNIIL